MAETYTTLWEAFASGSDYGGYDPLSQQTDISNQRMVDFYNQIVGPAFGGPAYEQGEGFGDVWGDYMGGMESGFDTYGFEAAERAFKLTIGDPYKYGEDPFAWENISRMPVGPGGETRAEDLLESELYSQGEYLGGEKGRGVGETAGSLGLLGWGAMGLNGLRAAPHPLAKGIGYGALAAQGLYALYNKNK